MSWLAKIRESNGSIVNMQIEPAVLTVELGKSDGTYLHELVSDEDLNGNSPMEFVRRSYYDSGSFVDLGEPPNEHAYREGNQWNPNTPAVLQEVRSIRNSLLAESDWTRMDDNGMSDGTRTEWAEYRQALRDITNGLPEDISSINDVSWPPKP